MKKELSTRVISMLTVSALCLVLTLTSTTSVAAAQKEYDLPSSVTGYMYQEEWDDDGNVIGGDWTNGNKVSYKYNKYGNIVASSVYGFKLSYKWSYKNKLPAKMTSGKKKRDVYILKTFDNKGRLASLSSAFYDKRGKKTDSIDLKYSYNKKGWISKSSFKWGGERKTHTQTFKYVFYKNGFPKKITSGGGQYDWKAVKVNSKGLITSITSGSGDYRYKHTYDKKNRVKTVVIQCKEDGKWKNSNKYVYKYKNYKTTNIKAYFTAINQLNGYGFDFLDDVLPDAHGIFGRG